MSNVPVLVLLNGPPASGKSTIAAELVARRPLALNLDIDVVRSLIGDWKARPIDAGHAARRLALAMARTHLRSGHDVIVPQFLARPEFIDELASCAANVDSGFIEIALMMSRADAIAAFQRRSAQPETAHHRDAAEAVDEAGGANAFGVMVDNFVQMLEGRAGAHVVDVRIGDIDATVAAVETFINPHA